MSIINDEHLELELGDIIKIMDLTHVILNNQTFIIDYIDEFKIKLINIETFNGVNLFLKNGIIEDYNIKQIDIINKSKNKGYARQHNLLPLTWINIHFNSNVPFILTGKIVELDQDMIEIKLIDNSNIFINFDSQCNRNSIHSLALFILKLFKIIDLNLDKIFVNNIINLSPL